MELRIGQLLETQEHRQSVYLGDERGGRLSFAACAEHARRNARKILASGVEDANVGLLAGGLGYVAGFWSTLRSGATLVPLRTRATEQEWLQLLTDCDCNWIVCDGAFHEPATRLAESAGLGQLTLDDSFRLHLVRKPTTVRQRATAADTALLLQTSGTTGGVKYVELSHQNVAVNATAHNDSLAVSPADRVLAVLPMSFSYAVTAQLLSQTGMGGSLFVRDDRIFFPKCFCESIERHKITITSLVPPQLQILNAYSHLGDHDLGSLRYLCFGGAPSDRSVLESLMKKLPATRFVHTYGLTEASPRVSTLGPSDDLDRLPSIGKPIAGVEVKIARSHDADSLLSAPGELLVRGNNVMTGYYRDSAGTRKTIQDGWLHTGDLATRDADGYLYLHGRLKHIILCGAMNICPEEIEAQLRLHPRIRDVLVEGAASADLGEVPVAHVSLHGAGGLSLKELHGFLRGKLSVAKWPRKLYVRRFLPRTDTGKLKQIASAAGQETRS